MVLILGPPKRYITTSAVAFINGQLVSPGAQRRSRDTRSRYIFVQKLSTFSQFIYIFCSKPSWSGHNLYISVIKMDDFLTQFNN